MSTRECRARARCCDRLLAGHTKTDLRTGPGLGGVTSLSKFDPEYRFAKATKWGEPPSYKPELGPCLIYLGADNGNGYGQFRYDGRGGYAHRYAWEREHGPIPSGLTVDHLCRVRQCVNVHHLELVDGPENTRRGAAARAPATHCKRKHEYAVVGRNAKGDCLACVKIREQARWARERKSPPGTDPRIKYDQERVRSVIDEIRAAKTTVAQGAREIGCNPNYLGRRTWQVARAAVLKRDGSCVMCGALDGLDVHHRINRGSGGSARSEISFGMANLIVLCRKHHSWVTDNTVEARNRGGWCLRRTDSPERCPVLRHGVWTLLDVDGGVHVATHSPEGSAGPG